VRDYERRWHKEGQRLAPSNSQFITRPATHIPQAIAVATLAAGNAKTLSKQPPKPEKKVPSQRVQNVLKYIIAQNPNGNLAKSQQLNNEARTVERKVKSAPPTPLKQAVEKRPVASSQPSKKPSPLKALVMAKPSKQRTQVTVEGSKLSQDSVTPEKNGAEIKEVTENIPNDVPTVVIKDEPQTNKTVEEGSSTTNNVVAKIEAKLTDSEAGMVPFETPVEVEPHKKETEASEPNEPVELPPETSTPGNKTETDDQPNPLPTPPKTEDETKENTEQGSTCIHSTCVQLIIDNGPTDDVPGGLPSRKRPLSVEPPSPVKKQALDPSNDQHSLGPTVTPSAIDDQDHVPTEQLKDDLLVEHTEPTIASDDQGLLTQLHIICIHVLICFILLYRSYG